MAEILDLDKFRPHITGLAKCLACKHEWQAVAPIGTVSLECPTCALDKGVFDAVTVPEVPILECACGCRHFFVRENWLVSCCLCGVSHRYEE